MSFPLNMMMVLNIVTLKERGISRCLGLDSNDQPFYVESSAHNYYINMVWYEICYLVLLQGMDWHSWLGCSENK
jgi:hypothetical protein